MSDSTGHESLARANVNIPEASSARSAMIQSIDTEIEPLSMDGEQDKGSKSTRVKGRSIEWTFFTTWENTSPLKAQRRNIVSVKCKTCSYIVRSRRETMHRHIMSCTRISSQEKEQYGKCESSLKITNIQPDMLSSSGQGTISSHLPLAIKKGKMACIEDQAIQFALSANLSFNALHNEEFLRLLQMLNPSVVLPKRNTFAMKILDRVSYAERDEMQSVYNEGAFVSLSCDGWVTPTSLKWLGFCRLVLCKRLGEVFVDVSRFEDMTVRGENETVIASETKRDISTLMEPNGDEKEVHIDLFQTRWYSHYGLIVSITRSRRALQMYKESISHTSPLLRNTKAVEVLDTLGSASFWSKLSLISDILRPLTIEIGLIERKGSNLSDVMQSFGRIWALLMFKKSKDAQLFGSLPCLLTDLLDRLDWRLNIYFNVDLLLMCHVLDYQARSIPESQVLSDIKANYVRWIQPDVALEASFSSSDSSFCWWRTSFEFDEDSPFRRLAEHALSLPAHAADLERVWSSTLLTFAPMRRKWPHPPGDEGSALQAISIPNDSYTDGISDMVTNVETALQEEDLHELVELFLNSEGDRPSSLSNLTEQEMDAIITGHVTSAENRISTTEPQRKRRRFPGYRRVTRKLKHLLDYEVYLKKAADLYKKVDEDRVLVTLIPDK
eukprot:IDg6148t1